jgi:large subunit ribosomal protein L16
MAMMPAKVKYRRMHRGSRKGFASRAINIDFGSFGLQALGRAWVTGPQIEAARVALTRHMKRKGKVWIRIFPHKSVTKKPAEVRMGQGKGSPEVWVAVVKPGVIMFEVDGVPETTARESLALAAAKLPIRTRFLSKRHEA